MQHLHRGLAGALVIIEAVAGGQRHQRLPQAVLVPAVHRVRAAAAGGGAGGFQVFTRESGE